MKYRADIDGLRAVAVLAVVLFHAGWDILSGGFIGVDIFFVISGFLITNILIRDLQEGRFSIVTFYDRRIRRIFPALFFRCAFTAVLGAIILTPWDFYKFGQSLIAATFFVSNMWFWKDMDYFSDNVFSRPLLHTWSLAVEEQFYIFFPIVLWGLFKWQRKYILHGFISFKCLCQPSYGNNRILLLTDPCMGAVNWCHSGQ